MKTAIITLSENGLNIALKIKEQINSDIFSNKNYYGFNIDFKIFIKLSDLIKEIFGCYDALIFIMSAGIVIRTIAPHIISKKTDPAIICIDQTGKFCISLLSGHLGGANRMTEKIAKIINAQAVITTATDLNNIKAFDYLAEYNNCLIEDASKILKINKAHLLNENIKLYAEEILIGNLPANVTLLTSFENLKKISKDDNLVIISNKNNKHFSFINNEKVLMIRNKNIVIGCGCKKNTSPELFEKNLLYYLETLNLSPKSIKMLATIDFKNEEACILNFCNKYKLECKFFSADELQKAEHMFTCSDFVKKTTGTGNVCETATYLASGNIPKLKKFTGEGMTFCVSFIERGFDL